MRISRRRSRRRSARRRAERELQVLPPVPRARPEATPRPPRDPRAQLKSVLGGLDNLLRAVEKTAWRVRSLNDQARSTADKLEAFQQRAARVTDTGLTLGYVGGAYRLHTTKAAFMSRAGAEAARQQLHEDAARRLYQLSLRQGGAFLKLGQMLASRPDLLPEPYVRELSKLQDAAPELPFTAIQRVLERELGRPLSQLFATFDERPLASASIGQVHRARLHDGREVAVKVQRPDIDVLVHMDMELLEVFVRALAEGLPPLDFDTIIRETRAMVSAELDYTREAELTAQMAEFFAPHAQLGAPAVVHELSTRRVLVTSLMPGEKISIVLDRLAAARDAGDPKAGAQLTTLLAAVFEAYARQVLEASVFQADPHPGNLLAHVDDERCLLTVLDFGCAKQLDASERDNLLALLRGVVMRDTAQMALAMEAMGFETQSGTRAGLEEYARAALSQLSLGSEQAGFHSQLDMAGRIAAFGRHIEGDPIVKLPEAFVMLGRVFGTLSGLFVHYRPDISVTARVLPVVFSALAKAPTARAA